MRRLYLGVFLISAATLLLELTLTRIFDVILWSNLAYLIVSSAIFGFGVGGIILMRWPMDHVSSARIVAAGASVFAATVLLLIPALVFIPANLDAVSVFSEPHSAGRRVAGCATTGLVFLTFAAANRIELRGLAEKRGVRLGEPRERVEFSRWDPVSKIDVLNEGVPFRRRIIYDGGSQSSSLFQFDGDFEALRKQYFDTLDRGSRYNSGKYAALPHWLKRDAGPRTLIIGS